MNKHNERLSKEQITTRRWFNSLMIKIAQIEASNEYDGFKRQFNPNNYETVQEVKYLLEKNNILPGYNSRLNQIITKFNLNDDEISSVEEFLLIGGPIISYGGHLRIKNESDSHQRIPNSQWDTADLYRRLKHRRQNDQSYQTILTDFKTIAVKNRITMNSTIPNLRKIISRGNKITNSD